MKIGALAGALLINANAICTVTGFCLYILQIIVAGLTAIIPDLDHPSGKVNQTILGINKKYFLMLVYSSIGLVFIYYGNGFRGYLFGGFIILMGYTRHRGFTHSIIGMLWFYLILQAIFIAPVELSTIPKNLLNILSVFKSPTVWTEAIMRGGFIGYVSHPGSDFLTNHGDELLWPNEENYRIEVFTKENVGTLYTIMIACGVINGILQVM